ncbi:hypothetical protein K439DRAFT_1658179 [Ramaria rubella]|nr:hypothetical protein K439DRAFT_1658179 [Ramaria rubella]
MVPLCSYGYDSSHCEQFCGRKQGPGVFSFLSRIIKALLHELELGIQQQLLAFTNLQLPGRLFYSTTVTPLSSFRRMCDAGVSTPDDAFVLDMYNKARSFYTQTVGGNPPPAVTTRNDAIAKLQPLLQSIAAPQFFDNFGFAFDGIHSSPPQIILGDKFHAITSFNAVSAANVALVNRFIDGDLPNEVSPPSFLVSAAGEALKEVGMEWTNNKTFSWAAKQFSRTFKDPSERRYARVEAQALVYNGAATQGGVTVAYDVIYFIGGWYYTKNDD